MKLSVPSRQPALLLTLALSFLSVQTPAWALLDFIFGKKDKVAPTADERAGQEYAAAQLLAQAQQAQSAGKTGRALNLYEQIVKNYPFTPSGGEAAFQRAVIVRHTETTSRRALRPSRPSSTITARALVSRRQWRCSLRSRKRPRAAKNSAACCWCR